MKTLRIFFWQSPSVQRARLWPSSLKCCISFSVYTGKSTYKGVRRELCV